MKYRLADVSIANEYLRRMLVYDIVVALLWRVLPEDLILVCSSGRYGRSCSASLCL
jgi:hypothetical protein